MSKHSENRCNSRHINPLTVDLLMKYGTSVPSHGGSHIRMITRKRRKQLLNDLKQVQKNLSSKNPPYLVESKDGEIITAGRRTKRIRR